MTFDEMTRRGFLKRALAAGFAAYGIGELGGIDGLPEAEGAAPSSIVVASKRSPEALVRAAVDGLGGMGKFVKRGARVVVKPNMAWARKPQQAATTNPQVVAEIVRLCKAAGAGSVMVIDHVLDSPDATVLNITGLKQASEAAGAKVVSARATAMYQTVTLSRGKTLKSADVLRDIRRADVFINVPIAKVHSATTVTLGCKNLMGVVWDRGTWHRIGLDQCIADFAAEVKPDLTILDAVRTLLTNGPKGPGKTASPGVVVAGTDPLAVDAYGATLLDFKPEQIGHLRLAAVAGVGEIRLDHIKVKRV
jgi:uncharacterized protein (DUF362 family)